MLDFVRVFVLEARNLSPKKITKKKCPYPIIDKQTLIIIRFNHPNIKNKEDVFLMSITQNRFSVLPPLHWKY